MVRSIRWLELTALVCLVAPAWAQFRVEVTGVGMTQLPVVIAPFKGEAQSLQKISSIVQADLERSGQFKGLPAGGTQLDEISRPDWTVWRQLSTEALLAGSVTRLADGRLDIRARLWDAVKGQEKSDFRETVVAADLRLSAHRIADWVYQQLTGGQGAFATRIAYVTKSSGRYTLWIADSDGEGAKAALSSPEPVISPSWAPSGTHLAYVSFESRKPVVYVHELASGQRRAVANFKGSNSAPTWAPDGQSLVATLSRDGGSQLFRIELKGGEPRKLTHTGSINTEPSFSADGGTLFFVSDRGGSPQIYRMPSQGGPAERVTFAGNYNISPALSPDGRWLAYVARSGSSFRLHLMDLGTGQVTPLTDTSADERPSFAPNSRLLMYATLQQGQEALMTTTLDGRIKARLSGQGGDIREPHWGPLRK
ncbi:Tol-Pal system beta propeller repeat protein TolB [Limnohabitans sp. Jir72]|uniref:Tol-Pal system beta propeller repeat protein TolB n=1 Tax=Limnohabitans sp. Jir72 TaxID=1977909 RepID=UPI001E635AA1|nr:Tol-Pal system beta propeller repeat protein TolB [Limnohabitans sp. Jir72]